MKSLRKIIYILVLIVGLLILKFLFFPAGQDEKNGPPSKGSDKGAKPQSSPTPVTIFIVEPQVLDNNLFATGTILANETVELKPEISGKVTGLYIQEGEPVKRGKLLVKLNDADLQAQLQKINAEIKVSEDKFSRYKQLLKIQGISREEYDIASNQLESLKADAEVLRVQIGRTHITAPFDGILGLRNISEGSFITPSQIVTTIQQLNPVKIDFSIPERYSNLIRTGSTINFSTEGSTTKYQGIVFAFEPGIDAATRSLKIRARANNPGYKLRPGAFAKIELVLDKNENALMIPTQAIIPILKGQQVFISRNGKAEAVSVETGLRNEKMVQIIAGLNQGDSVIITGLMGLRPGAELKFLK